MRANNHTNKLIPVQNVKFHKRSRPFVDKCRVLLSSGRGGDGAAIMDALPNKEFAGPIGGNGGQGGSVFVKSSNLFPDLFHIRQMGGTLAAGAGTRGRDRNEYGSNGKHLIIDVPLGTVLRDADSNAEICDFSGRLNETVMVLEGGLGGKGNAAFKSSVLVSPINATRGLPGNSVFASLELKTLADVSLVGLPNAGKSSILGAISSSRPEVAAYPFTTLNPFVGKLYSFVGDQTCDVADLPGLVEGAYENRGLGHQFLQHVERSKLICLVVDMHESYYSYDHELQQRELMRSDHREEFNNNNYNSSSGGEKNIPELSSVSPSPVKVIETLIQELYFYDPALPSRISAVLCNKMDLKTDVDGVPLAQKFLQVQNYVRKKLGAHVQCFPVSANMALHAANPEARMQAESEEEYMNKYKSGSSHDSQQQQEQKQKHKEMMLNMMMMQNPEDGMRQSGLPSAIEFLTQRVFELKKKEKEAKERKQRMRDMADQGLYDEHTYHFLKDPVNVVEGNEGSSEQDQDSLLLNDQELAVRDQIEKQQKKNEALARLMEMKGSRKQRLSNRLLFNDEEKPSDEYFCMLNSKNKNNTTNTIAESAKRNYQGESMQAATNFTSSKRDYFGSKKSNNSSLFDDQFGQDGFANDEGPLRSTYSGEYSKRAAELSSLDDEQINGVFRVNNNNNNNNNFGNKSKNFASMKTKDEKNVLRTRNVPETVLSISKRATYGSIDVQDQKEQ